MTTPRLASSVLVSALLKRAESEGGFGTVIAKGERVLGAVAILLVERGKRAALLERLLQPNGTYCWQESRQHIENADEFQRYIERRRSIDPDLWLIELDIASAERFAAEINSFD